MLLGPKFTARNRVVLVHEQDSGRSLGCGLVREKSTRGFLHSLICERLLLNWRAGGTDP